MLFSSVSIFLTSCLLCSLSAASSGGPGIRIYKKNPRYWEYRGKPTLLIGGTDDENVLERLSPFLREMRRWFYL